MAIIYASPKGSPAQMTRGTEETLNLDDGRAPRRKNTAGDQSMRRSIQDLVSSIDPSVKIEPDVEDVSPRVVSRRCRSLTRYSFSCCSISQTSSLTRSPTFPVAWPNTAAATLWKFEISNFTSNGTTTFAFPVSSPMKPGCQCRKRPSHPHLLPLPERAARRRVVVRQHIA